MTYHDHRGVVSLMGAAAAAVLVACSTQRPATIEPSSATPSASSQKSSTVVVKDADGKSLAELFRGKLAGVDVFEAPGGGVRVKIRDSGEIPREMSVS